MELGQQKEQFSRAYVYAVTSVAGYSNSTPIVDDDSIDLGISGRQAVGKFRSPRLELQLKCTENPSWSGDHLHYALKLKNYVDLRGDDFIVPRILVVVVVPEDLNEWVLQSEKELTLRKCGYWLSLREYPETQNKTNVTVQIPRKQQFTVKSLRDLMNEISGGSPP
jgi:uncharacterized protein DUF4365